MNIEKKIQTDTDADITPLEENLLDESLDRGMSEDDTNLKRAELDNTDEDGELLNEESSGDDVSGEGLDIPGAAADDDNELIGEEDEENNSYSEADTE